MTRITTLYTLPRERQAEWYDATGTYNTWNDVRRVIADWAGCELSQIDSDDDDMICVDGEPVAFVERRYVRSVVDLRPAGTVDLRHMLAAE
jgi:hypothetical protein